MNDYLTTIIHIQNYTGMHFYPENSSALIAYLNGINLGVNGKLLAGFELWLCSHLAIPASNQAWNWIILQHYFPNLTYEELITEIDYYPLIKDRIFSLLTQFLMERNSLGNS